METCTHPSSSSSSSTQYDVFLSVSGANTPGKFALSLYHALESKGVRSFIDDEELHTGQEIGTSLLTVVEQCRISIPIFSSDYASSIWCLQKLAKILECYKTIDQIVLPIFLDIEPSEVRNQTGSFGEAFRKHEEDFHPQIVHKWKEALTEVGELKGYVLKVVETGDESKLIEVVVDEVLAKFIIPLNVAKYPIGIKSHVENLLSLSSLESTDTQFVGICGMGGIGKTTMAKALYNKIFKIFDGSSFLADVRENASQLGGLVHLQMQLLYDIVGNRYHISHLHSGSKLIEARLRGKKILLVLDDVDHPMHLNALAGAPDWFGRGSRIIITTRDEHVLKAGGVSDCYIYKPTGLDYNQSLQLFSLHAFKRDHPPKDYMKLSRQVVSYAGGLPLTLEVLGSYLCDVDSKEQWESTLQKLKKFPFNEVSTKLKTSFDGLDAMEKAIFLGTACFFVGMNKEFAINIWNSCGFYPNISLNVLIRKSLVLIGDKNELTMHDQLRDMGSQIVYDESPKEPGERSRLWSHEDVIEVLQELKGTRSVEGICFYSRPKLRDCFRFEDFAKMSNLRFLLISGVDFEGNIEHLPSRLRCLHWRRCPLEILPSNFYLEKLCVLDLSYSNIRQAWNNMAQNRPFANLKILDLSQCLYLAKSPNFSGFPQLEKLILENCTALGDVDESIGNLKRLVHLNLGGCIQLMGLPSSIGMLYSLQELHLFDCFKLNELPESIGDLKSLLKLKLDDTQVHELPNSIGMLSRLRCLSLIKCRSLRIILDSIGEMKSLVELYLDHMLIKEIPDVGLLEKLEILHVQHCQHLTSLPKLPSSLICLDAQGCISLKRLPDRSNLKKLRTLQLINCGMLDGIPGLEGVESLEDLDLNGCISLKDTPRELLVQVVAVSHYLSQDSFNNQPFSFWEIQQYYDIGDLPEQMKTSAKMRDSFSMSYEDDEESYSLPKEIEIEDMQWATKRRRHQS